MNSFLVGLQLLFIALKLTDIIDWSWWLVITPFLFIAVVFFTIVAVPSAIIMNAGRNSNKNKE